MNFFLVRQILRKIEFQTRCANMEIDAYEINDISKEECEKELKKSYLSLQIWLMRLANVTGMNLPEKDESPKSFNDEFFEQLPLFPEYKK
tara:strand:+ start:142 stop:411 length:270 start_codon:yes stop_codon:yes gene_type:complete